MSLIERVFPASELAALKHAVLAMDDAPAAKRRKIEREGSVHSRYSNDSGYHSDRSTNLKDSECEANSPASSSHSDEDDFCTKIAEARARLYSNASLSIPSPPQEAESPKEASPPADYHSPVSVESLADSPTCTSGCNLDTFIRLGLAVTTHERSLLSAMSPLPKVLPIYQTAEIQARKLQLLQRRKVALMKQRAQLEQERRPSYQGFAISSHAVEDDDDQDDDDQDDDEEQDREGEQQEQQNCKETFDQVAEASIPGVHWSESPAEQFDDFFNIEAASEAVESEGATKS